MCWDRFDGLRLPVVWDMKYGIPYTAFCGSSFMTPRCQMCVPVCKNWHTANLEIVGEPYDHCVRACGWGLVSCALVISISLRLHDKTYTYVLLIFGICCASCMTPDSCLFAGLFFKSATATSPEQPRSSKSHASTSSSSGCEGDYSLRLVSSLISGRRGIARDPTARFSPLSRVRRSKPSWGLIIPTSPPIQMFLGRDNPRTQQSIPGR